MADLVTIAQQYRGVGLDLVAVSTLDAPAVAGWTANGKEN